MLEKYRREQREKEREQLNNLRELEIGQKVKKFIILLHLSERFPFFSKARTIGRIVLLSSNLC